MSGRLARFVAVPVLIVMLGFIVVLATSDSAADRDVDSPLLGRQAPGISGDTVFAGDFDLEERRGEWVLVNFFAPWCVPCIQEHPELVAFADRHEAAGDASIVSVVYDSDPDNVRAFFAENGGDWPVVEDPDGRIALTYGVSGVPETYVISPEGVVVAKFKSSVTQTGLDRFLTEAGATP